MASISGRVNFCSELIKIRSYLNEHTKLVWGQYFKTAILQQSMIKFDTFIAL